ncbi:hypothetical protein QJS10_CPB17g01666 [Acorus calamus]|uniref:Uncharacterized protein n=1 Tax=Acorus calamus TaxID=4465 RepID=A0AAV9CY93_ACOCL|nr:hypothetical protein QJS10_CPB17g01666 [Acorus calamus]
MAAAVRAAILRRIRIPVGARTAAEAEEWRPVTGLGFGRRMFSSHDDHLEKGEVVERVLSVVKSFPKVDPSKK